MYPYETLLILDPRLNEEEVAALLTKVQETLKTLGGEVNGVAGGERPRRLSARPDPPARPAQRRP